MTKMRMLLLGCPGAGKGTQTKRILSKFPLTPLASGDLLRQEILQKSEIGLKVQNLIKEGHLVSDDIITPIMLARIPMDVEFLLDGFPRTVKQAKSLDNYMGKHKINFVANLDVPHEVILKRIEERWIHAPSGRTYNLSFNPPLKPGLDDVTGEPLSKRPDDDVESFRVRLQEYAKLTEPLEDYYAEKGIFYNFKGKTSDEITPKLFLAIEKWYNKSY